ncbi:hypothetical protein AVEN_217128-1 [Araneus ventricosus]|uniref:Uncharacterized protein n=1 Tax=Araneus ventricosus TaxID=182803 RepID=A0A4Y2E6M0_ARAVE|nr:hypothetical protein AVEN_217128-1 [Araneus ventricosus]
MICCLNTLLEKNCVFNVRWLPYHFASYYRRLGRNRDLYLGLSRSGKPKWGRSKKNKRTQFIWSKSRSRRKAEKWLKSKIKQFD